MEDCISLLNDRIGKGDYKNFILTCKLFSSIVNKEEINKRSNTLFTLMKKYPLLVKRAESLSTINRVPNVYRLNISRESIKKLKKQYPYSIKDKIDYIIVGSNIIYTHLPINEIKKGTK